VERGTGDEVNGMPMEKVVLATALSEILEHWRPRVVGALNGQEVKLAKFSGTFPWHHHDDADELFLGVQGTFRVEFRDRVVTLGPGEFLVVPRGVEHRTVAEDEAAVLLFEPAGVRNTGNVLDPVFTAPNPVAE
jgi:quercetin dioxygenase-like cupin family protein